MRDFKSRNSFKKLGHDRNQSWDDSFFVICTKKKLSDFNTYCEMINSLDR